MEEEAKLRQLAEAGENVDVIAAKLGRNRDAVMVKAKRSNVRVVGQPLWHTTTNQFEMPSAVIQKARIMRIEVEETKHYELTSSSAQLPADPPTSEEALKILVAALDASKQKRPDKVEVARLNAVTQLTRTYEAKDYSLRKNLSSPETSQEVIRIEVRKPCGCLLSATP